MKDESLYSVGEIVMIKDIDSLRRSLGDPIKARCGWFDEMDRYAGKAFKVKDVRSCSTTEGYWIYKFEGTGPWWFSEDVLEPFIPDIVTPENCSITFEDVMGMR